MSNFLIILMIIINFIFQSTILPYFEIFRVVPNTALIIVVVLALAKGKYYGGFYGLLIGLIQDIMFSSVIGINAFILFFAGYTIGYVEDTFARDNILNPIVFTFLATVYYNILYSLFQYFLAKDISFIVAVKSIFSFEVIYNCLFSIVIYKLFHKIFSGPKIRFGKK